MAQLSDRVRGIVRADLRDLEPYDPSFTPCEVNLSANENTYGMPEAVRAAVNEALCTVPTNRYPDPMSGGLRDRLAARAGLARENVCVGNGGDELLFNFFLAFGGEGHVLLDCPPSFGVYRIYSQMVGTEVLDVPRDPETFEPDYDELAEKAADASMVIVTTPNNPTGNLAPREQVARLCSACPGIVMADEAYIEFAGPGASAEPLLAEYDNLVVLHTLSKAFCMAGARLGYVFAAPDVVDVLGAVRQPYSVNVFSQVAAEAVLDAADAFQPTIDAIVTERARLTGMLSALPGVRTWSSAANFVLLRVPGARRVRERLRDEFSILVRDFSATPGLADCLRITVGTMQEDDRVIDALAAILEEES